MVSLEFEKPSTWSIGKKLGLIAIIFLIVGSFLPHHVYESSGDIEYTGEISNFDYDVWGLWMLIPPLSGILLATFLYIRFDINLEMGPRNIRMKPFFMMIWGIWFFLTYLADATRYWESVEAYGITSSVYPGIGLWMIVAGFFLCAVVGFLEWKYPTMVGPPVPKVGLPKRKEKEVVAEAIPEPSSEVAAPVEAKKPIRVVKTEEEVPKEEPLVETKPIPVTAAAKAEKIEAVSREPTSEEEKTLLRWARHIAEDGKTFEQCMKCEKYVFLSAKDTGDTIVFKCPECGESYTLNK